MENILTAYESLISLGNENPLIAGMVGIWFAAITTLLLREFPKKFYAFIKRQVTTSLIIYDHTSWSSTGKLFGNFQDWVENSESVKISRVFTVSSTLDSSQVVPGTGLHIFIYKNRLFWFNLEEMDSSGSEKVKRKVTLNTFGRDKKVLDDIFKKFKDFDDTYAVNRLGNFVFSKGYWNKVGESSDRDWDSVFLNEGTKNEIISAIDGYENNKDFYTRAGIPYKTSLLLYGPPGTGKTSIIKAVANYLKRRIYILPLGELTSESLISALSMAKGGIVVIEDVDGVSAIKNRDGGDEGSSFLKEIDEARGSGIHDILNAFDGVIEISDIIIIMTTNHLEKIDPAFLRPGRTDHIIEVGLLDRETISSALSRLFGSEVESGRITVEGISGANLVKAYKDNYPNLDKTVNVINTYK